MMSSSQRPPVPAVRLFRTDGPLVLDRHGHDQVHLCLLLRGAMMERNGPREVELLGGGARVSPSGDEHRIRFGSSGGVCAIVHFPRVFLADLGLERPRERRFLTGTESVDRDLGGLFSVHGPSDPAVERLEVQELAVDLLFDDAGAGCGAGSVAPPWLLSVYERLRDDPLAGVDLRSLAEQAGVHPGHLTRAFRAHFGCSPSAFSRWCRLRQARRRVVDSDGPLAAIAHDCGFTDQPHMTRWFRRTLGVTPAMLRAGRR